ncbi:hypothetical protein ABIE78_002418 [Sinorhizobium fredii]|nr:hypothetical protein [Sinorhizobium fredii]
MAKHELQKKEARNRRNDALIGGRRRRWDELSAVIGEGHCLASDTDAEPRRSLRELPRISHIQRSIWGMPKRTDKAGMAFLVLICILIALVVSILALDPGVEEPPPAMPTIVPDN